MPGSDARLHSRPGRRASVSTWPPGLHRLADDYLLRVPDRSGPLDLLVFFHGAGGSGASSLPSVQQVAAARGLLVLAPTSVGSTWDLVRGRPGPDVALLDDRLGQVLVAYDVASVAFGGFSDGASYALSLGLANGDLADAVLAFSPGFLAPPNRVGTPRVWLSHGTADQVLPVDRCGRQVVAQLRRADYDVEYVEFDGGHVVLPELVAAAATAWLGSPPAV